MDELFGAPLSSIALTLLVVFTVIVGYLAYIALRNTILLRMALRNVVRRPARTLLAVTGLMLATAIVSIAFTVGDSLTFSIKSDATDALRELDEFVGVDANSDVWEGIAVPETFPQSLYEEIGQILEADPDIAATLPEYSESIAVVNTRSRRFEVQSLLIGVQADKATAFEALSDIDGTPLDIGSLAIDEVYIDVEGAEEIDVVVGGEIEIALGPDRLVPFTVKAIVDGYYWRDNSTKLVVMTSLAHVQNLLGAEGELTRILISNRGDQFEGVQYSESIEERLSDTPAITEAGLELVPLKADLVERANAQGSQFVLFFTLFGLFSIGVGLLLIFLIFSMLAAERKSEMGMARAVGMQRQHLTRMFLAEGAMYGIGSAVVGALVGVGLGLLLVFAMSNLFSTAEDFTMSGHVSPLSVLTSFLLGAVVTLLTVFFASWRISNLNIVRAIRDIPDPAGTGKTKLNLILGLLVTGFGLFFATLAVLVTLLPLFLFGLALLPIGVSLILRWGGISQRVVLSLAGLVLVVLFVLPNAFWDSLRGDWNDNISGFFISGVFLVTGAVLLLMNNSSIVLLAASNTIGRHRRLAPIIKSAVAYPLRYGFRTGLSVAMFALVVFSVAVLAILIEGFNQLFDDEGRLGGGYDVFATAQSDLNPILDLRIEIEGNPDLAFVSELNGRPEVGTFRTVRTADGLLPDNPSLDDEEASKIEYLPTSVTGVDADFIETNGFDIGLATTEYLTDGEFDARRLWEDLAANPGLAVVSAFMVPTRNDFNFEVGEERLVLDVEGLFVENDVMDPVRVTVRDLESGTEFDLTVIGVLDNFVSGGPIPTGLYTASEFLTDVTGRHLDATQFFINIDPGTEDPAGLTEAALFEHGISAFALKEMLEEFQGAQKSFFNLLLGFMLLGLVVGIASLGVISARAVVERRHAIGVMRAVGFSRSVVLLTFLAESSFIAMLGIGLGLLLGIITGINVIADIKTDTPDIQLIIPWTTLILIAVGGYVFSLVTTLLPARRASRIAPAEALRYE